MAGRPWAVDNGAFSDFNAAKFVATLEKLVREKYHGPQRDQAYHPCLFVNVPDKVADACHTRHLFASWYPILKAWPLAYTLQDGQRAEVVPWDLIAAVFVGGSTEYKVSPAAAALVLEARARGLWVHWGRVNTRQRVRYLRSVSGDSPRTSFDGSGFSKWSRTRIPIGLRWARDARQNLWLF
jgi:hypothetical protein